MIYNPNVLDKIKTILEIKIKKLYIYFTNEKIKEKFTRPNFFTFDKIESNFLSKMAVNSLTPDVINQLSKSSQKVIYTSLLNSKLSVEKIQFLFWKEYVYLIQKKNLEFFIQYRSTALLDKNSFYTFIKDLSAYQINDIDIKMKNYMQKLPSKDHRDMIVNLIKNITNQDQFNSIINDYFNKWNISSSKRLYIFNELSNVSLKISNYVNKYFSHENNFKEKITCFENHLINILLSNDQNKKNLLSSYEDLINDLCFSDIFLQNNNSIINNLFKNKGIKLNKYFMKLILFQFALKEKTKMNLDELKVEFREFYGIKFEGNYFKLEPRILINASQISENINENLNFIETIFHELEHHNQEIIIKTKNPPIEYLPIIKDIILNDCVCNFWINNYVNYSFEYNAYIISLNKIKQFISEFKIQTSYRSSSLNHKDSCFREVRTASGVFKTLSLDDAFDLSLSNNSIALNRQKYPLLGIEYDELGQKIDIETIKEKLNMLIEYEKRNDLNLEERKKICLEIKTCSDYLNSQKTKTLSYH